MGFPDLLRLGIYRDKERQTRGGRERQIEDVVIIVTVCVSAGAVWASGPTTI